MVVSRSGRESGWVRWFLSAGCALWAAGCGSVSPGDAPSGDAPPKIPADQTYRTAACSYAPATLEEASTLIVLDWEGGPSPVDPTLSLSALDPRDLPIDGTVASDASAEPFKEAVQLRVEQILCDLNPVDMRVIQGRSADYPDATQVHLTIESPPSGGRQAGQADYDPCNRNPDDTVTIWAGRLVEAAGEGWGWNEWVNMVANVCAHEIGHTLGFAHPDEDGVFVDENLADRALMLSSHTISSLAGPQAFLIAQITCPASGAGDAGGISYSVTGADLSVKSPVLSKASAAGGVVLTCGRLVAK